MIINDKGEYCNSSMFTQATPTTRTSAHRAPSGFRAPATHAVTARHRQQGAATAADGSDSAQFDAWIRWVLTLGYFTLWISSWFFWVHGYTPCSGVLDAGMCEAARQLDTSVLSELLEEWGNIRLSVITRGPAPWSLHPFSFGKPLSGAYLGVPPGSRPEAPDRTQKLSSQCDLVPDRVLGLEHKISGAYLGVPPGSRPVAPDRT